MCWGYSDLVCALGAPVVLQAFLADSGRRQQPQPLIWNGDGRQSPFSGSSSSTCGGDTPSTSNSGPEASCSSRYASSIQSFDDWDFEDDFAIPVPCNLPVNEASVNSTGSSSTSLASISSSSSSTAGSEQLWPLAAGLPSTAQDILSPADLLTSRSLWQSLREVCLAFWHALSFR